MGAWRSLPCHDYFLVLADYFFGKMYSLWPDEESGWQILYQLRRSIRIVLSMYFRLLSISKKMMMISQVARFGDILNVSQIVVKL